MAIVSKIKNSWDELWKNGAIHIFIGSFVVKIVSFFGSIFLVRTLNKQEYGILGYLENIYGYALVLAGMGMSNAILRYVILGRNTQEKYNYFSYAYRYGVCWNIGLIIVIGVGGLFYPHPVAYREYAWLLPALMVALPFQCICDNILCCERAMFANQRYAFLSLFLSFSIISSKIMFGKIAGVGGTILGQTAIYALLALFFLITIKRKYFGELIKSSLAKKEKVEMNIYSFQYMITNGLWAIFMLNDTFLLGRYCPPEAIASYKVAYAIPGSVSLISSSIGVFIAPYFVKNENNKKWVKKSFIKTYSITAAFVAILCAIIAMLAKPIIYVLYGMQYMETVGIMRILLLAAFCNCGLRFTTANILAAMGKVKYNMLVSFIGVFFQIVMNLKMIPSYGVLGVGITSCIVYGFMAVVLLIFFIKEYYI